MNNFFFFCSCFWAKEQIWTLKVYRPSLGISLSLHSAPLQVMAQCWEHSANKLLKTLLLWGSVQFSSVHFSRSVVSDSLWPHGLQQARPPCPLPSPGVCPNPCPLSRWCHPTISSSVVPFSSCLRSFPASGSFLMSQFLHQVAKVLEFQHQSFQWIFRTDFLYDDWLDLLHSKGLLRVFSNITIQKHQFFGTQISL